MMWRFIGGAPDFWGNGPGFESGISYNNLHALQDHGVKMYKSQDREVNLPLWQKKDIKRFHNGFDF